MSDERTRLKGHELFYFSTCPYCIKVRLALWWLKLALPPKNIISDPEHKSALITGGGKKQVPCLRIENDQGSVQWMYESSDIIRYLRHQVTS